jgi:F0F1-type ATP synthase membrane subunit b/b'
MEQSAISDIKAYAAEISLQATAEIIAKQLDEKSNSKLVDQSIKSISEKLAA